MDFLSYFSNTDAVQRKKDEHSIVEYIQAVANLTVEDFINLANYKIYLFNRIIWEIIINGTNAINTEEYQQKKINDDIKNAIKEIRKIQNKINNAEIFSVSNELFIKLQQTIENVKITIFAEMENIKTRIIKEHKLNITLDGEKSTQNKNVVKNSTVKNTNNTNNTTIKKKQKKMKKIILKL